MPDRTFRVTSFFESGRQGWSETFWVQADSVSSVEAIARAQAPLRMKLCGYGVKMTYLRISDEAIRGDSTVVLTNWTTSDEVNPAHGEVQKVTPAVKEFVDVAWNGLLIRHESGPDTRRLWCMRGVPDDLIIGPEGPKDAKPWADAFGLWKDLLITNKWGFMAINKNPGTNPTKLITDVVKVGNFVNVIIPAHGFLEGEKIRISGAKADNPKAINGVWQVSIHDANTVILKGNKTDPGYLRDGAARAQRMAFAPITATFVRRQAKRNPGRPFDQLPGRRVKR